MRKPQRTPNRQAVARSLRELEKLFGKKPPDRNDKGLREQAFGATELSELPAHNITKLGGAA